MSVAYSTSDSGSDHTGAQIRVAAMGPQAANVTGLIDQTDLYQTLLGRPPDTLPNPPDPPSSEPPAQPKPPKKKPKKCKPAKKGGKKAKKGCKKR